MALSSAETLAVAAFGRSERIRLEEMRDNFKEKGSFGLRWDSTVSSNERRAWWYLYLFTFRKSDKSAVISEIEKYIKLYENIENIRSLTFEQIEAMEEQVKEALKEAKLKLESTDSSTVYNACKALISKQIDKDIEKIKNAVGSQEYKKLKSNVHKIVKEESDKWKKTYQTEIAELKKTNEKQAEEYKKTTDKLQQKISAANLRLQNTEQALLFVGKYLAQKDGKFAEEAQKMLSGNQTPSVEIKESLFAVEGQKDNSD